VSEDGDFLVRFWGVRGSIATAGPETVRYGGNTSCVEMRCGDRLLVFDSGTGARKLGQSLMSEQWDFDHFFSHTHFDHIAGLPFFSPAYRPDNRIRIRAGHLTAPDTMENALRLAMSAPMFPVPFDIFQAEISFEDFTAGDTLDLGDGITVRTAPLNHPNEATGYRVEYGNRSICYLTDTEHVPDSPDANLLALMDGADIAIYDTTYTDEEFPNYIGWGHSTWQEGLRLAEVAGVKTFVLFHHDPNRTDDALDNIAKEAKSVFSGAVVAREGDTLRP
jgi:phosphoribosyl 1,2-cyclic phosphodiesterase